MLAKHGVVQFNEQPPYVPPPQATIESLSASETDIRNVSARGVNRPTGGILWVYPILK
jgi:hypothetical protein